MKWSRDIAANLFNCAQTIIAGFLTVGFLLLPAAALAQDFVSLHPNDEDQRIARWATASDDAGTAQAPAPSAQPAPPSLSINFTYPEVQAAGHIFNEFIKTFGVTRANDVRNALALFEKFQAALRADVAARQKSESAKPATPKD